MTTETVASSPQIPTTDHEKNEKTTSEEEKASEQDSASLSKGSGEVPKTEDSASIAIQSEPEGVDHKEIEPPVVEAGKTTDAPEPTAPLGVETKVDSELIPDSQTPETPKQMADAVESLAEVQTIESVVREAPKEPAEEITEIGQVEQAMIVDAPPSSVEAIEKLEEPLEVTSDKASGVPLVDEPKVENEPIPDSQTPNIPNEVDEIGQVEQPKIVDAPQSSVEHIEKLEEPLEVTSQEGSVAAVLKETKDLEPESLEEHKPDLAIAEVEEKAEDQSEFTQQAEKKHDEAEPEQLVQDETVKDKEPASDEVELTTLLEEGKTKTEDTRSLAAEEESEQPKLTEQEKKHDEVVPEKSVEDKTVKAEGSLVDKIEESTFPEEGTTEKDDKPSLIGRPEEASLSREAPIDLQDEVDSSLPAVTEYISTEDQKKESSKVDVAEKLNEESAVETEKVGDENVETVEDEKGNVIPNDSTHTIKEGQNKELNRVDVVEKVTDEAAVEPEKVGEENVTNNVETKEDDKRNVITEDSTEPITEIRTNESGVVDVVKKLEEEPAVKLENVEEKVAKNDGLEENEKVNAVTEDSTQPIEEAQKKEVSVVDVVEKIAEEAVVETEKSGEENETKNVKFEGNENRNVTNEVPTQKLDEVIETSFEGAGKDVEPAVESGSSEDIKDEIPAKVEAMKDESADEKQDDVTRAVNEPLTESKQSEPEGKGEETVEPDAEKLEKVVDDVAKPDQTVEPLPTKDGDLTKPSEDLPKEVPAKPSQKQSNTIMSKVKQSLVKAKKAITGKSPSSETPASVTKDDVKVK